MNQDTQTTPVSWRQRFVPQPLREVVGEFRRGGFRAVIQRFGWKICAGFVVYYLVRDSVLYLLIPYLIARGFLF